MKKYDESVPLNSSQRWRSLWVLVGIVGAALLLRAALGTYFGPDATAVAIDDRFSSRQLPKVNFRDSHGKEQSLTDYRGRVVLLNLWATWCFPCRKEMASLDRLQAQLGGSDFEVVAVSIDASPNEIQEFFSSNSIKSLALYIDPTTNIATTLGSLGIPTTLLVDRNGREVWRKLGPAEWDAPPMMAKIRAQMATDGKS
ncbi:MAG: TlpA family protein disulfide reductase [Rhodocyclaceae bacterium]|nr:TlpA family protein disulfide reductase [Rhodocyclaceae bacterium]